MHNASDYGYYTPARCIACGKSDIFCCDGKGGPAPSPFEQGRQAKRDGKRFEDNPYIAGRTALGSLILTADGEEWERGRGSVGRICSKAEVEAAAQYDVSRFRRRSNRSYR